MNNDILTAIKLLKDQNYTCVLVKDEWVYHSTERGVKPLLQWLKLGTALDRFSAADKVVGKAAAFLYVLLGVKEVYACVISKPSVEVLEKHGIKVSYDTLVDAIRNRTDTGFCPMEQAVKNISSPKDALVAIKSTVEKLKSDK